MTNIQHITLDICSDKQNQFVYTKQYDVGRTIVFTLMKDGKPISLENVMVQFVMSNGVSQRMIVNGSKVHLLLTASITDTPGIFPYHIELEDGDELISSVTGYLVCEEGGVGDD